MKTIHLLWACSLIFSNVCFSLTAKEPEIMSKEAVVVQNPTVLMKTSLGDITIELYPEKAPITVANFLEYVNAHQYDHTIFHRVIKDFMVQGGGFTKDMQQKSVRPPIKNEAANGLSNKRGTIAMARTGEVNSATAQFFINTVDNDMLDYRNATPQGFGYCVFGKVIAGMDVVDKIRAVKTGRHEHFQDVPVNTVEITEVRQLGTEKK